MRGYLISSKRLIIIMISGRDLRRQGGLVWDEGKVITIAGRGIRVRRGLLGEEGRNNINYFLKLLNY